MEYEPTNRPSFPELLVGLEHHLVAVEANVPGYDRGVTHVVDPPVPKTDAGAARGYSQADESTAAYLSAELGGGGGYSPGLVEGGTALPGQSACLPGSVEGGIAPAGQSAYSPGFVEGGVAPAGQSACSPGFVEGANAGVPLQHAYSLASQGGAGYLDIEADSVQLQGQARDHIAVPIITQQQNLFQPPASNPPAAVGAASANNREVQRRQSRTATHSRTTVVEGMFGVVLPGKKASDGKNMYVVCSTTADPGTGLVEIYDTKAAVAKTMPRLTVRLKNVVSVENAVIRQKPHVVVEDSTRVGKPLMITTTNAARLDAVLSFLGQPGAGAGMGTVGGQLGGPTTDYSLASPGQIAADLSQSDMPGAVGTIPQPAMGNGTARNERKANLGLGGANEETRM